MKSPALLCALCCLLLLSNGAESLRCKGRYRVSPNVPQAPQYSYETAYFDQLVDHFSFLNTGTFKQRYLINTDYWKPGAPIFFYTGNEGNVVSFCNNTGFMWSAAPEYSAMVVFAEHRYYGESLPFGPDSFKDSAHLGYLTSEQALADFVELISFLQSNHGPVPVVAFGGSYGGMLAAWLRMKYPHVVAGAIAASAPVWWFDGLVDCNSAYQTVSTDFKYYSPNCAANINNSWAAIDRVFQSSGGPQWLTTAFSLCKPLTSAQALSAWLEDTWFDLAMVNYPYPANFLAPLPAWPMNATCAHLSQQVYTNDRQLLAAMANAAKVYHNYTGAASCLNVSADPAGAAIGGQGWNFQACTEMIMPMCSGGEGNIFPPQPWNMSKVMEDCKQTYNVTPRHSWVETLYGGKNITSASNIVFSNGALDPWHGGGVLESLSDTLVAVVIKDGAHHLDLRAPNPADPADVLAARQLEKKNIDNWITTYYIHDLCA